VSSVTSDWSPSMQLGRYSGQLADAAAHGAGLSRVPHPQWPSQEPRAQPACAQPMGSRQTFGPGWRRRVVSTHLHPAVEWTEHNTLLLLVNAYTWRTFIDICIDNSTNSFLSTQSQEINTDSMGLWICYFLRIKTILF